jgi:uncharacterized membrane protein YdjX (TVP38/TMEM64 family)
MQYINQLYVSISSISYDNAFIALFILSFVSLIAYYMFCCNTTCQDESEKGDSRES